MSPTVRPFYGSFGWAFDLLVERPVAAECAQIGAILGGRGVASDWTPGTELAKRTIQLSTFVGSAE